MFQGEHLGLVYPRTPYSCPCCTCVLEDFCPPSGLVECLSWKTWDLSSEMQRQGGQNASCFTSSLGPLGLWEEMTLTLHSVKGRWVSVEAGVKEWPLAELPASMMHGQNPGSRLWDITLENLNFQSICQVSDLALFPSTSRELLSKGTSPRPIFPDHVFLLPNTACGKFICSSPLHSFVCRYFLKRGKAPRAEVFIVTFPCLLPEAALVLSGHEPGLWCAPCTSSTEAEVLAGAQSLVLLPASHHPPGILLHREEKEMEETRIPGGGSLSHSAALAPWHIL